MLELIFKRGQIQVDSKTFKDFKNQIGKKEGKYKEEDGNKDLEISLCKYCFPNSLITKASIYQDIYENIDCIVNNVYVQVKCRKDDILTLEHEKIQENISKGSWLDRSKAELDLFVFEKSENNILGFIIYYDKALKKLLEICRKYFLQKESLEKGDFLFIEENSIDLKSISFIDNKDFKLFKILVP